MKDQLLALIKSEDLRKKILYVLWILLVFRIIAAIPISAIDVTRLNNFFAANPLFGLLNVFTGSTLANFSLVMLGLGPYITAVIIMQLLTMIFPKLKDLYQREGEAGRQRFNQYGRILTVPLSALQGYGVLTLLVRQNIIPASALTPIELASNLIIITAGTVFLMWLGELISTKGIGNGVSLLIFAGIISNLPSSINQTIATYDASKLPELVLFVGISLVVVAGVVFISEAQRRVPVSYAKRVRGRRLYGGASTYLPLKVNQAGVIPIIFALSILLFPNLLATFFSQSSITWLANISTGLNRLIQDQTFYSIAYFILVFGFTYFYTQVTFDPKVIAENLQKAGGFIPGIRPGQETVHYLNKTLNRITLAGAVFLGVIAVLPNVVGSATGVSTLLIGGTAVLIVVSVILETVKQIDAQLSMRQYE